MGTQDPQRRRPRVFRRLPGTGDSAWPRPCARLTFSLLSLPLVGSQRVLTLGRPAWAHPAHLHPPSAPGPHGLLLQDWPFDDGAPPPGKVVEDWLSLLKAKFCDDPGSCVAVHCVAGLGR